MSTTVLLVCRDDFYHGHGTLTANQCGLKVGSVGKDKLFDDIILKCFVFALG